MQASKTRPLPSGEIGCHWGISAEKFRKIGLDCGRCSSECRTFGCRDGSRYLCAAVATTSHHYGCRIVLALESRIISVSDPEHRKDDCDPLILDVSRYVAIIEMQKVPSDWIMSFRTIGRLSSPSKRVINVGLRPSMIDTPSWPLRLHTRCWVSDRRLRMPFRSHS